MKTEKTFFCIQFKKILKEKDITQQELAKKIGVAQSMISQWLTGTSNPNLNTLKKLSSALEVPLNYFLENVYDGKDKSSDKKDIEFLKLKNENLMMSKKILTLENEILKLKLKLKDSRNKS